MPPTTLTPTDIAIIRCLQEDARLPVRRIANRLRVPESTVRHRLNRLVKRKIIAFTVLTDPLQTGYQVWVTIDVQTHVAKARSVARRFAEAPEVYFAGVTTGAHDVHVAAVFRSNTELLDFLNSLGRIPGISRTSTANILEVVKRTVTFPLFARSIAGSVEDAAQPGAAEVDGARPTARRRRRRTRTRTEPRERHDERRRASLRG